MLQSLVDLISNKLELGNLAIVFVRSIEETISLSNHLNEVTSYNSISFYGSMVQKEKEMSMEQWLKGEISNFCFHHSFW